MAESKKKAPIERTHSKPRITRDERGVVVGSEVGITLPIDDTTAHIRFSFWHERIAKDDTVEEIRKTVMLVDEFNEAELERRIKKYRRLVRRELDGEPKKKKGKSVQERAKKRMKK